MRTPRATPLVLLALLAAAPAAAQQVRTITIGRVVTDSLTAREPFDAQPQGRVPHLDPLGPARAEGRHRADVLRLRRLPGAPRRGGLRGRPRRRLGRGKLGAPARHPPRDGRYQVVATAYGEGGRGAYTLGVSGWETPEAPPAGAVTSLSPRRAQGRPPRAGRRGVRRRSVPGPLDVRRPGRPAPARGAAAHHFDSYVMVLAPDGQTVGADDDGLGDNDAALAFRASAAGRYTATRPATVTTRVGRLFDRAA